MGRPKLTNEQYDLRYELVARRIKRLTDYRGQGKGQDKKIIFSCLLCGHKWENHPDTIRHSGCARCAGNARLNNNVVDEKLKGRKITRIGNVTGSYGKMKVKCSVCAFEWFANTNSLLNHKTGCPRCANKERLSKENIAARIQGRSLILIGEITRSDEKTKWQCMKCNFVWHANPNSILGRGSGCPRCAKSLKRSEDSVYRDLKRILPSDAKINRQFIIKETIKINEEIIRCRLFVDFQFVLDGITYFVEYNGRQHYDPVGIFGGANAYRKQVIRDCWLREYCTINDIKLIEIDGRIYNGPTISSIKSFLQTAIGQI